MTTAEASWLIWRQSGLVSAASTLLCAPLAWCLAAAWATTNATQRRWWISGLLVVPWVLPTMLLATWLTMVLRLGSEWVGSPHAAELSTPGLGVLSALVSLPLMARVLQPALAAQDPMLQAVSRTLGASRWQAWWHAQWPMVRPALAVAMVLGWATAWGECGVLLILLEALAQPHTTLAADALQAMAWWGMGLAVSAALLSEWMRARWQRRAQVAAMPPHTNHERSRP